MCAEKYLMAQKPAFASVEHFVRVWLCVFGKSLFRIVVCVDSLFLHFFGHIFWNINRFISSTDHPQASHSHICIFFFAANPVFLLFFASFKSRLGTASLGIWFPHGIFITRYLRCFFFSSVFAPPPPPSSDLSSACEDHKSIYPHWTPTHSAHSALALFHDSTWHLFILFGWNDWHHFLEQVTTLRKDMTSIGLTGKSENTKTRISVSTRWYQTSVNVTETRLHDHEAINWIICCPLWTSHLTSITSCWLLLIYSYHPPWDSYPMKIVTPTLAARLKTMTADRTGRRRAFTFSAAVSSSRRSVFSVGMGLWVAVGRGSTVDKNY